MLRLPPKAGPSTNPAKNDVTMTLIPCAIFVLSQTAEIQALQTTDIPIEHPCKNLVMRAHQKVVLNPNANVVMLRNVPEMIAILVNP